MSYSLILYTKKKRSQNTFFYRLAPLGDMREDFSYRAWVCPLYLFSFCFYLYTLVMHWLL